MKDKCIILNLCEHPHTCCHFCNKKDCDERCEDEIEKCKYLTDHIRQIENHFETINKEEALKEAKAKRPKNEEIIIPTKKTKKKSK